MVKRTSCKQFFPGGNASSPVRILGGCGAGVVTTIGLRGRTRLGARRSRSGCALCSWRTGRNCRPDGHELPAPSAADHTALFINADEGVLFDPRVAGKLPNVPERNDLHYGMTPQIGGVPTTLVTTRETHYKPWCSVFQVSMETALRAKQLASEAGPVPPAHCAVSTIAILRELPGFGDLRSGYYPHRLMEQIAAKPGVITSELHYDAPKHQCRCLCGAISPLTGGGGVACQYKRLSNPCRTTRHQSNVSI